MKLELAEPVAFRLTVDTVEELMGLAVMRREFMPEDSTPVVAPQAITSVPASHRAGSTRKSRRGRRSNKSQHIRDYFARHKDAAPKHVVEALQKRGVSVSSALVSNVKSRL